MALFEFGSKYDDGTGSVQITNVDSFLQWFREPEADSQRFYFRGDGKTLVPHIGKPFSYGSRGPILLTREQEWKLIHRFRRFANPQVNSNSASSETLFLARHHELPTRLLDWSTNPLVALYFALGLRTRNSAPSTSTDSDSVKYVWAITLHDEADRADIDVLARRSDPLKKPEQIPLIRANGCRDWMHAGDDAIKIVFPIYNSARITAQRGVFTWQSDPWKSIESYAQEDAPTLPEQNLDVAKLYRWSVPNDLSVRTSLVCELQRVGINARSISPDLDGVCHSLVEGELLFSR